MEIIPFIDQVAGVEALEAGIRQLGTEEPQKAYLLGIALAKMGDKVKKEFNDGFRSYYDTQKELPAWFECKISTRRTYQFEEDAVWAGIKATLDAREATVKAATELAEKGGTFTDPNTGEIVDPVSIKYAEIYSVSKKG